MDVQLARTFLAVVESGSFVDAARRVHVTQSTVSMRIKVLEDQLGTVLFARGRSGARLTVAGELFCKHALSFVRVWEQARLEVAIPAGHVAAISVGGQPSLWDGYLLRWLPWMRRHAPQVAIRAQLVTSSEGLMQRLIDGVLDLAVLYRPHTRPGIEIQQLFEEHLVLVSSEANLDMAMGERYVFVDWGPEFQADHALNFPDVEWPGIHLDVGSISISYLLENSASGYFPLRIAQPHVDAGDLVVVEDAPVLTYPTYVAFPTDRNPETVDVALDGLRRVVKGELPKLPTELARRQVRA